MILTVTEYLAMEGQPIAYVPQSRQSLNMCFTNPSTTRWESDLGGKDGETKEICLTVKLDFDAHSPIAFDMNGDGDGILVDTSMIDADGSIDDSALFGDEGYAILEDGELQSLSGDGHLPP